MAEDSENTLPTESAAATSDDYEAATAASESKKEPEGNSTPDSPPKQKGEAPPDTASGALDPPGEESPEDPSQERNSTNDKKKEDAGETSTDATMESDKADETITKKVMASGIVVSSSKKSRPPYKFDPDKITLRFLFANRDGLTVTVECKPTDTVREVKSALISVWPEDMPNCDNGENLRLVCMGKGYLTPDTRTLEDCHIPVFKTHPTPVNVSVKPSEKSRSGDGGGDLKKKGGSGGSADAAANAGVGRAGSASSPASAVETGQGCGCVIL